MYNSCPCNLCLDVNLVVLYWSLHLCIPGNKLICLTLSNIIAFGNTYVINKTQSRSLDIYSHVCVVWRYHPQVLVTEEQKGTIKEKSDDGL